jgi:23S rRNA maturation-related 3'-5' exoribonuclease YhaM
MLDRSAITDALRARVRKELPEVEEIGDAGLAAKVVEAWALALASSSFGAIAEIEPSGNPGVNTLKRGSQTDHIRGVTRMALALAGQLQAQLPDLVVDRDILIAGALCHDSASRLSSTPRTAGAGRPSRAPPACPRSATRPSACTSA